MSKPQPKLFQLPQNIRPIGTPNSTRKSTSGKQKLINAAKKILETPKSKQKQTPAYNFNNFAVDIPQSIRSQKHISNKENPRLPPRPKAESVFDNDLIYSMQTRIKQVQKKVGDQRKQLKTKNQELEKLQKENANLKVGSRSQNFINQMKAAKAKHQELKQKFSEMEAFLNKNGVTFTKKGFQGKLDDKLIKQNIKKPRYNYCLPTQVDIKTIATRINQLNQGLVKQGYRTEMYSDNGIHKLRQAKPLDINFYKNGIFVDGYPFYYYKQEKSLKILSDIVEGYFPFVLKQKYPNGVLLNVVDQIANVYGEQNKKGITLNSSVETQQKQQKKQLKLKKNNSVQKLQQIIQEKESHSQINEEFEQIQDYFIFKTKQHLNNQENNQNVCTLKIRSHDGKIYILELSINHTMKQIYKWMKKVIVNNFELASNFPKKVYGQQLQDTLQTLGFYPNALLHVHINHHTQ